MNQRTLKELSRKATRALERKHQREGLPNSAKPVKAKGMAPSAPAPEPEPPLETPRAEAVLMLEGAGQYWVTACPHCGKERRFGAGLAGVDDARRFLGHRIATCCGLGRSFALVEAVDPQPQATGEAECLTQPRTL